MSDLLHCTGKCIPLVRIPEKTDDPAELQLTWLKKELEGATPSSYNSLKFYQRFSELCKHHNIEVSQLVHHNIEVSQLV